LKIYNITTKKKVFNAGIPLSKKNIAKIARKSHTHTFIIIIWNHFGAVNKSKS